MNTLKIVALAMLIFARGQAPGQAEPGDAAEISRLNERVAQLEKQVQEMSELLQPLRVQQAAEGRRKTLRSLFDQKTAQDREKYNPDQLREAESLYQVANQKWGTAEAKESLEKMIQKYPDINRTGCATLYVAQKSRGEERAQFLRQCIEKFGDCMYGDGVQVGAYARFLLAEDYRRAGELEKSQTLIAEIRSKYPQAVDHRGTLLLENQKNQ
jgi:hypothetical protein